MCQCFQSVTKKNPIDTANVQGLGNLFQGVKSIQGLANLGKVWQQHIHKSEGRDEANTHEGQHCELEQPSHITVLSTRTLTRAHSYWLRMGAWEYREVSELSIDLMGNKSG